MNFQGFGGVRLHADQQGRPHDPPVLLVHGGGQSPDVWKEAEAALVSAGRRVVTLHLRGHGRSEWPDDARYAFEDFVQDLRAVLAQLDGRPVIVASTMGGWISTAALAGDSAELAAGLVLVDLPIEVDTETQRRVTGGLRELLSAQNEPHCDVRFLDRLAIEDIPQRLAAAAPTLRVPVLLIRGGQSDMADAANTAAFVGLLTDVEFAEVADARLLVTDRRMDEFNALLLDFLERRQPRDAPEYRTGSDARTLRDALGCFATGVTVVTAKAADGTPIGLTANSFTSVSLDPPLLLVCIANGAGSAEALLQARHFAVNVLQIGQQPSSNRFASKGEDRFTGIEWSEGEQGAPVLNGSLGAFECERHAVHEGGDHFILVGRVRKATFEPRRDPLLYFRGKYRRLHFG
jgi:flavin reductase (DIM6/NTAB) family NADH-FMN oxidoreductase RutF/pimeloyl-ACP methyl ester carboxylesterase